MTETALTHSNQPHGNNPVSADLSQVPDTPGFDNVSLRLKELRTFETVDLLEKMHGLRTAIDMSIYAEAFKGPVRENYIACNLILNERMFCAKDPAPAPAFRPQPKRTNIPTGVEAELSNIVRVIDMHFCAMMRHIPETKQLAQEIFRTPFDFDKAFAFACHPGRISGKLKFLDLDGEETIAFCRLGNMSLKTKDDHVAQKAFLERRKSYLARLKNRGGKGNPDHASRADILAVGSMLKALDFEIDGKNLMLGCRLIGRRFGDRPSRYKHRHQNALEAISRKRK